MPGFKDSTFFYRIYSDDFAGFTQLVKNKYKNYLLFYCEYMKGSITE